MAVNGIDETGPRGSRGSFRLDLPPFLDAYVETCAGHIAEAIGPEEILGIFLCGSFALGEGGISLDGSKALLVSDIDILVVVERYETLERMLPKRYELGRSCEDLTSDMEFIGRVDVGIMLPEDLENMPPRPGVFDLKRHGRAIYGSEALLDLVPEYGPEQIGGRESVSLLENRIASLLGAFERTNVTSDEFPYSFLYEIARVYTDIATAFLSISGRYAPGYENRSVLFEGAIREKQLAVKPSEELASIVSFWTGFKLRPSRSKLEGELEPARLLELWEEASARIVSCWSACESYLQGRKRDECGVSGLLAEREHTGGARTNLRAWRSFLAGRPIRSRLASIVGAGKDLCRYDPSSLVRATALRLMAAYIEGKGDAGVEEVPGFPGRRWDSWNGAAADISALWREIVYGRGDA